MFFVLSSSMLLMACSTYHPGLLKTTLIFPPIFSPITYHDYPKIESMTSNGQEVSLPSLSFLFLLIYDIFHMFNHNIITTFPPLPFLPSNTPLYSPFLFLKFTGSLKNFFCICAHIVLICCQGLNKLP